MGASLLRHVCAGAAAAASLAAQAQNLPVLPRPTLPDVRPAPAPPLDLRTPARPALAAAEGGSVRVERFAVSGATRVAAAELDAALAPFTGRTLRFAELSAAAEAVTALYRRQGWLFALAYLPEQRIQDGVVEIVVLEGRLGTLALGAAPAGVDRAFAASVAEAGLAPGDAIGEANLVRNLLLLNDWPALAVSAEVKPGRTVGTADVTVDLRETGPRGTGSVALDNLGSKATGRTRIGASYTQRESAGRGDRFDAQLLAGTDGGLASAALSYGFTLLPGGTRLAVAVSHLRYTLVDPAFDALDAKGEATYLQATLDQPLLRRVGEAVTLRAGLVGKRLRDRVEAFAQHEDRHVSTALLGLRGEHGAADAASTTWSLQLTAGQLGFDDDAALAGDAVLRRTAGRFGRINLELEHQRPVGDQLTFVGRFAGQQAVHRNLDSAERSVIGGPGPLRAYGELSTQADVSLQVSIEARWRWTLGGLPAMTSLFGDLGNGRADRTAPANVDNGIRAKLAGLGLELQLPAATTLRAAVTRQIVQAGATSARATRGWFELIQAF